MDQQTTNEIVSEIGELATAVLVIVNILISWFKRK